MSLLILLLIFLGFYLLGDRIVCCLRPTFATPLESFLIKTALGLVGTALVTTGLAFVGGIYPATGWTLLGLIALGSLKKIGALTQQARAWRPTGPKSGSAGPHFMIFNSSVLVILGLLALTLALAPAIRTDALVYHLAIPKAYLENHGFINLPNNMYSFFPLLFEMVYLFAMTFGSEALPALVGLGMAGLLLAALAHYYQVGLAASSGLPGRYGLWVAVLFFSVPTFWEISASAYIDIALAGFVFFTFYSWDRWRLTRERPWFLFMAVFAASAWATKLTAFIVIPLVVLGIALVDRRDNNARATAVKILAFLGIVFCFMVPWWARNFFISGNPFVPLFMQVLGGADRINWDAERMMMMDQYVKSFGMGRGLGDFLRLPYNLTFHSQPHSLRFDGTLGLATLVLLPAVLGLWKTRSATVRALGAAFGVMLLFWFIYFQYIRFLAPAFTLLALLLVCGWESGMRRPAEGTVPVWKKATPFLVAVAVIYNLSVITETWSHKGPLKYLSGQETRDQYLSRHTPRYPLYQAMNQKLAPTAKVFFVYMRNLGYLAERDFISDSVYETHTLQKMLTQDPSPGGLLDQMKRLGATHIMFDFNFVFGLDSGFSPEEREALKNFFNTHARLVEGKNPFFLYAFVLD